MKLFLFGLALLATAYGEYSSEVPQDSLAVLEEIESLNPPSNQLDDGYRYRTVRRFRARHRRDVSELISPEYLPPQNEFAYQAPVADYLAPIAPEAEISSGFLADDGYRYKTVRKLRHRQRRDVSELTQYLPPVSQEISYEAPSTDYLAPIAPLAQEPLIASGLLADDGYRYKTVRKLRHRQRRDVSELTQYLPPASQEISYEAPSADYLAPIAPLAQEPLIASGLLADDGYRYKTVRKLRHRQRRDVSELTQYLPPASQEISYEAPSADYLAPISPLAQEPLIASGLLADDGYRYKTVRKLRHRQRRDVSELTQYLPPASQEISYEAPSADYLAPISPLAQEPLIASGLLADDGYRYKTVRKLRHRQRRDVSELTQYLPPASQEISYEAPSADYLAPISPLAQEPLIASGLLADDGYRYKTVRKLRHRQRRDVNELESAQYLPPVQQIIPQTPVVSVAPIADIPVIDNEYLAPLQQTENILADDGYRYKTVKRFKIRRH